MPKAKSGIGGVSISPFASLAGRKVTNHNPKLRDWGQKILSWYLDKHYSINKITNKLKRDPTFQRFLRDNKYKRLTTTEIKTFLEENGALSSETPSETITVLDKVIPRIIKRKDSPVFDSESFVASRYITGMASKNIAKQWSETSGKEVTTNHIGNVLKGLIREKVVNKREANVPATAMSNPDELPPFTKQYKPSEFEARLQALEGRMDWTLEGTVYLFDLFFTLFEEVLGARRWQELSPELQKIYKEKKEMIFSHTQQFTTSVDKGEDDGEQT